MARLPITQFAERPGIIDLAWGHPDPALVPVDAIRLAASSVLDRYGADALNYGYAAGPGPLREWIAERLGSQDARTPDPSAVVATAGNSQALDQLVSLLTGPGDVVLVEDPTYHLAVRILRDHPVELVGVPAGPSGLDPDALRDTVDALRARNRSARLLYTVPTFNNPTGTSLPDAARRAIVELAAAAGFTIVEDDAYRELFYDRDPPPSLWSFDPGVVVRLVSFSKSLAPGLRTGCLVATPALARRVADSGVLDSGGGISHFSSLVVAELGRSGVFDEVVGRLRVAYRERRDALLSAIDGSMAGRAAYVAPSGGYFVWLTVPDVDATALLPAAEARGVSFVPGSVFHLDGGGENAIRLSFSRYPPPELEEAVGRLAAALDPSPARDSRRSPS